MLLPFLLLAVAGNASSCQAVHFGAEDQRVDCPVALPPDVAKILRDDPGVQRELQNHATQAAGQFPSSWFLSSAVHLAGTEQDIVVMAAGPLRSTESTTFWVFRPTAEGHELILTVAAHDLIITHLRSSDYRILETDSRMSTHRRTARYRFEGSHYTVFEDTGWL